MRIMLRTPSMSNSTDIERINFISVDRVADHPACQYAVGYLEGGMIV